MVYNENACTVTTEELTSKSDVNREEVVVGEMLNGVQDAMLAQQA